MILFIGFIGLLYLITYVWAYFGQTGMYVMNGVLVASLVGLLFSLIKT